MHSEKKDKMMKKGFMREELDEQFRRTKSYFDWLKVLAVMATLDWQWDRVGVPKVGDMKKEVDRAYNSIATTFIDNIEEGKPSEKWIEFGGFRLELAYDTNEDGEFDFFTRLTFMLEDVERWGRESD